MEDISLIVMDIERDMDFSPACKDQEEWVNALAGRINWLIVNDFSKLVSILYRLDVSELKIRQLMKQPDNTEVKDAGTVIGSLIIDRQLTKYKTRQRYSRDDSNIPEDDKW